MSKNPEKHHTSKLGILIKCILHLELKRLNLLGILNILLRRISHHWGLIIRWIFLKEILIRKVILILINLDHIAIQEVQVHQQDLKVILLLQGQEAVFLHRQEAAAEVVVLIPVVELAVVPEQEAQVVAQVVAQAEVVGEDNKKGA